MPAGEHLIADEGENLFLGDSSRHSERDAQGLGQGNGGRQHGLLLPGLVAGELPKADARGLGELSLRGPAARRDLMTSEMSMSAGWRTEAALAKGQIRPVMCRRWLVSCRKRRMMCRRRHYSAVRRHRATWEKLMTLNLSRECGPTGEPLRMRFAEAWVADDLRNGTVEIDAYGAWDGDDGAVTPKQLDQFEKVDRGLIAYEGRCAERGMPPMRWRASTGGAGIRPTSWPLPDPGVRPLRPATACWVPARTAGSYTPCKAIRPVGVDVQRSRSSPDDGHVHRGGPGFHTRCRPGALEPSMEGPRVQKGSEGGGRLAVDEMAVGYAHELTTGGNAGCSPSGAWPRPWATTAPM